MLKLVRLEKNREIYTRDVGWEVFNLALVKRRRHGHTIHQWVELGRETPRVIEQESAITQLYAERELTLDGTPRPCA